MSARFSNSIDGIFKQLSHLYHSILDQDASNFVKQSGAHISSLKNLWIIKYLILPPKRSGLCPKILEGNL